MATSQDTVKPERFGRYVLLDRIGAGGMAEVFRAVMPGAEGFRRTLVVKRILAQFSGAASFVEMFVQEAQICSLLNHPNIVAVYDFGQIEGSYFLAMEYLRGRNLQAVSRKLRAAGRVLPVPIAAFIAHEVAMGLAYAHELTGPEGRPLSLVHRDVSPSNIMCLTAGGVKLLDFGIAKALGETAAEARKEQGTFKGKISYTAPERLQQEVVDARSDVFSLGVVLWEMLAGRRLFLGASEAETARNLLEMPIPAPSTLRPDLPPALEAITLRALARDPAQRYQTAQELADELEEVVADAKYQAKMLPALLRELFGAGLKTGQLAVEGLEEELAAVADASISRSGKGELEASPRRKTGRWIAASAAVVGAGACAFLLLGRGAGAAPSVRTAPAAVAPLVAPQDEGAAPLAPPVAAAPSPAAPETSPVAAIEPPVHAEPSKKPARARVRVERDRIARGLSIDPFADASK